MSTVWEDDWVRVVDSGCWIWKGSINNKGYGQIRRGDRLWLTHRWFFQATGAKLLPGLELDHKCSNPPCCNPAHLEQVTHAVNARRGRTGAHNKAKTHCPQGHEYTADNTYIVGNTRRQCRICTIAQARARYLQKRSRA